MHQICFRPDPTDGAYSVPPDSSWRGGGSLPPPQEPQPRSRPSASIFGPSGLNLQIATNTLNSPNASGTGKNIGADRSCKFDGTTTNFSLSLSQRRLVGSYRQVM